MCQVPRCTETLSSHQTWNLIPVTSWLCDFRQTLPGLTLGSYSAKVKMMVLTSVG